DTGGYFDRAIAWLKARHGGANIVCAAIHLDETTPHLVAYIVPLTKDGRLSARDFLGGAAKLQDADRFPSLEREAVRAVSWH
ncbi:plasmid recombination protein, partial [Pseudomonas sp. CCC3.2]|uniref:plasmid recombination protein n=1 Tax=Pseudomonas sp. CCC3.2 TaxID=3048608 RepID=UPI002B226358